MIQEQERFIKALQENEDDNTTRVIYADWLDDHDQPEEADRMRKWPAAKTWLKEFTKSINYNKYKEEEGDEPDYDNPIGKEENYPHTYEDIIKAGYAAISGEGYCFSTDDGAYYFREGITQRQEFFKNWSIVTGVEVPEEVIDDPPYSCAC